MHLSPKQIQRNYAAAGAIFTAVLGTLWHFLYDFTRQNFFVGLIAPINESTWEHMKLLFFPMLIFICYQTYRSSYDRIKVFSSGIVGILTGLIAIPLLFYGYTAFTQKNYMAADIFVFLISVCLAFTVHYFAQNARRPLLSAKTSSIIMVVLILAFMIFSYRHPDIFIFRPPA